jgi:predicted NAD-dependent protein-ADP-ribosyltransferase YbiA (DUF1768 family)
MNETPIKFFSPKDPYFEFSNYYKCPVTIDGHTYNSTEHYYQAQKHVHNPEYYRLIQEADSPQKTKDMANLRTNYRGESWYINKGKKHLGQMNAIIRQHIGKISIDEEWDTRKIEVMRKALRCKFGQDTKLRDQLKGTYPHPIEEASPYDSYWGIGKDGKGQNWLGKLLEELRDELIQMADGIMEDVS